MSVASAFDSGDDLRQRLALAIPQEIRKMPIFLLWRREFVQGDKALKVPYTINGKRRSGIQGSAEDRAQLATFDEALPFVKGDFGLGLALLPGNQIVALDFDNCVEAGSVDAEIRQLAEQTGSYTEFSPSGKGVRILLYGTMASRKNIHPAGYNVECFHESGYVTLTGRNICGDTVEWIKPDVQKKLELWLGGEPGEQHTRVDQLTKVRNQDPIYRTLQTRNAILKDYADGKVGIECPFSAEHTSGDGPTSAVYFLPNTNGYARGHFDCKHAHCAHRGDEDFLRAIGLKDATPTFKPGAMAMPIDAFLQGWQAPEYLIDDVLRQKFLYGLTGHSNAGKTAIALMLAISVATGKPFGKHQVEGNRVLYFAGENAEDIRERLIALCQFYKLDAKALAQRLLIVQARFPLSQYVQDVRDEIATIGKLGLIIVDTRAAYASADDENDNVQSLADAMACRQMIEASGAAVVVLNHPPHSAQSPEALKPRGGSAYLNELDGNLTVWNDGAGNITLSANKIRGPQFEAISLGLEPFKLNGYAQRNGKPIQSIVAKVVGDPEAEALEAQVLAKEDQLLATMAAMPKGTIRTWGEACGMSKSALQRALDALAKDGLVRRYRRRWMLTKKGGGEASSGSKD